MFSPHVGIEPKYLALYEWMRVILHINTKNIFISLF